MDPLVTAPAGGYGCDGGDEKYAMVCSDVYIARRVDQGRMAKVVGPWSWGGMDDAMRKLKK